MQLATLLLASPALSTLHAATRPSLQPKFTEFRSQPSLQPKVAEPRAQVYLQEEDDDATPAHWVKGTLDNGNNYWWRYDPETDADEEAETEFEEPYDAWRVGELPSGQMYTWRFEAEDEDDVVTMMWTERELSTGAPYWFADDGTVALTDPFDLSIVQSWTMSDGDESEDEEDE